MTSAGETATAVQRALASMGGLEGLSKAGAVALRSRGVLDKAAEGQGFAPGSASPGDFVETLAFDVAAGRVARAYREDRYDGTFEAFRVAYLGGEERIYVVDAPALVIPARSRRFADERRRIMRRLPHLLLAELLEQHEDLTQDGERWLGSLSDGTRVSVVPDSDGLPAVVAYECDIPARGRTEVIWHYGDYRRVDGLGKVPHRYSSSVGGLPYIDVRLVEVVGGADDWFGAPDGHRRLPEQDLDGANQPPAPLALDEVGDGVFRVPGVRGGFAPLVVHSGDRVVVVDAPASFPLLGMFPADETDPAPSFSWHSERLVDAVVEAFGALPIHLVLTHAHEDHAGGVRAFVAAGATIHGGPSVRPVVERIAALRGVDDRLAQEGGPGPVFEEVVGPSDLGSPERPVRVVPIEGNPHAADLIAVHVPDEAMVYVSDVVTPADPATYPSSSHAALDRFFARWLQGAGLQVERVYAMHGAPFIEAGFLLESLVGEG